MGMNVGRRTASQLERVEPVARLLVVIQPRRRSKIDVPRDGRASAVAWWGPRGPRDATSRTQQCADSCFGSYLAGSERGRWTAPSGASRSATGGHREYRTHDKRN